MIDAKDFPTPSSLQLPIDRYQVNGYTFGQRVRSRIILFARHLGDDVVCDAGTPVIAAGDGIVVASETRPGSQEKRNWGGLLVIGHRHKITGELFFTLYGHMRNLTKKIDERVMAGQELGIVALGHTPENGYWKLAHLHFGVYTGPWTGATLPGYARPFEGRTKFTWWADPRPYILKYNEENP